MTLVEIPIHVLVMKPGTELLSCVTNSYKRCKNERPFPETGGLGIMYVKRRRYVETHMNAEYREKPSHIHI